MLTEMQTKPMGESFIAMLDKPMTRSETDSNALPRGRLTRRHETNYARQRDVRNVTYRRDGKLPH